MYIVLELDIYAFGPDAGHPVGAYGPFNSSDEAYSAFDQLSVDHQDDPVEFTVLKVVPYNKV